MLQLFESLLLKSYLISHKLFMSSGPFALHLRLLDGLLLGLLLLLKQLDSFLLSLLLIFKHPFYHWVEGLLKSFEFPLFKC